MWAENDLILVTESIELGFAQVADLVFVCWLKRTWFFVSIGIDFVFVWVVDIDLISLLRIELNFISV